MALPRRTPTLVVCVSSTGAGLLKIALGALLRPIAKAGSAYRPYISSWKKGQCCLVVKGRIL